MLYLGFGQVNVLIMPVYLIQKALVLQFKLVKQPDLFQAAAAAFGRL